jgi:triosephosphate isomerase
MARIPLITGNWKLNLDHLEATHTVQKLAWLLRDAKHDFNQVEVAVLPSFTSLRSVQTLVDADKLDLKYGAQDISSHVSGAFTGEVAGSQLAKLGCDYVAVGHSERREHHHESSELLAAKVGAAFDNGIVPILCVGEGLDVRKDGKQVEFTLAQIDGALAGLDADRAKQIVIAYEPVWAIGTGEVATPEDAQEVCGAIRGRLAELYDGELADGVRVLYGGSVKSSNIASIMDKPDVDGALVGGASLDPEEFAKIARFRAHQVGL